MYGLRVVSPLELIAQGEYQRDLLRVRHDRDSKSYEAGGALRVRVFGRRVSGEGGFLHGALETTRADQEYVQDTAYGQVRTAAIPRTYLSLRYRTRTRYYVFADPKSSNFRRQDKREQVTCYVDLTLWGNVVLNLSAGLERAFSTKVTSRFRSRQFAATLSVMLPGS